MTGVPFRMAHNNFAAADAATVSSTSALVSFPVSWSVSQNRSERWMTAGSFLITEENRAIYITDDGGSLLIQVDLGWYATGAALAAEIQAKLNDQSSNWTCTYSLTTGKFTIDRLSGTKTLRLNQDANAMWDTIGYLGVSPEDAGEADIRRNHTSERWKVDLGSAREVTCFFVYGRVDQSFTIPDSATVVLRGSSLDDFDTAPFEVELTPTESGIYWFSDDVGASTSYRFWWLDIIDRENSGGPSVYDLKVWIGDYDSPIYRNVNSGFRLSHIDRSALRESAAGVRYASLKVKQYRIDGARIEWISGSDREAVRDVYRKCGTAVPFFLSLDPAGVISEGVEELTKLVTFELPLESDHQRYDKYALNMTFLEVVG